MKTTLNHVLLVFVLAVVLSSASADALPELDNLTEQLCAKTHYADICLGSVKGLIKGKASVISVLQAEIDATAKETDAAIAKVAKLLNSASSEEKETLSICKENYEFAIDSLTKAKSAISAHDLGTLTVELGAAVTYAGTCDDAYEETPYTSSLTKEDQLLMGLASSSDQVVNLTLRNSDEPFRVYLLTS